MKTLDEAIDTITTCNRTAEQVKEEGDKFQPYIDEIQRNRYMNAFVRKWMDFVAKGRQSTEEVLMSALITGVKIGMEMEKP